MERGKGVHYILRRMDRYGVRVAFVVCAGLIVIVWLVFGQTVRYDFVNYDDARYVYKNPVITSGLTIHGVVWAFTHAHANNWHPLTTLSHMLDCQLFELNAGAQHCINVLLHTIAVLLLFLVLRDMTGSTWRSAFVAAIFAIHPLDCAISAGTCSRSKLRRCAL